MTWSPTAGGGEQQLWGQRDRCAAMHMSIEGGIWKRQRRQMLIMRQQLIRACQRACRAHRIRSSCSCSSSSSSCIASPLNLIAHTRRSGYLAARLERHTHGATDDLLEGAIATALHVHITQTLLGNQLTHTLTLGDRLACARIQWRPAVIVPGARRVGGHNAIPRGVWRRLGHRTLQVLAISFEQAKPGRRFSGACCRRLGCGRCCCCCPGRPSRPGRRCGFCCCRGCCRVTR